MHMLDIAPKTNQCGQYFMLKARIVTCICIQLGFDTMSGPMLRFGVKGSTVHTNVVPGVTEVGSLHAMTFLIWISFNNQSLSWGHQRLAVPLQG